MRAQNNLIRKSQFSPLEAEGTSGSEREDTTGSPTQPTRNFHLSSYKKQTYQQYLQIPNHASVRNTTALGPAGDQQWIAHTSPSEDDLMAKLKESLEPSVFNEFEN